MIKTINPLSANPEKWSNTLKQIVGNLPTICLSVFDHFMNLALKGLKAFDKSIIITPTFEPLFMAFQDSVILKREFCVLRS